MKNLLVVLGLAFSFTVFATTVETDIVAQAADEMPKAEMEAVDQEFIDLSNLSLENLNYLFGTGLAVKQDVGVDVEIPLAANNEMSNDGMLKSNDLGCLKSIASWTCHNTVKGSAPAQKCNCKQGNRKFVKYAKCNYKVCRSGFQVKRTRLCESCYYACRYN
tara:strand:- start:3124 stop:3609 length:486 start_codon:yes stop_codon:yes gene_type:complete